MKYYLTTKKSYKNSCRLHSLYTFNNQLNVYKTPVKVISKILSFRIGVLSFGSQSVPEWFDETLMHQPENVQDD